jgi:hypothetical protein
VVGSGTESDGVLIFLVGTAKAGYSLSIFPDVSII